MTTSKRWAALLWRTPNVDVTSVIAGSMPSQHRRMDARPRSRRSAPRARRSAAPEAYPDQRPSGPRARSARHSNRDRSTGAWDRECATLELLGVVVISKQRHYVTWPLRGALFSSTIVDVLRNAGHTTFGRRAFRAKLAMLREARFAVPWISRGKRGC